MSSTRNFFQKLISLSKNQNVIGNTKSSLLKMQTAQTTTFSPKVNHSHLINLYNSDFSQNITKRLNDFVSICPMDDKTLINDLKNTEINYYEKSLQVAKDYLDKYEFIDAKKHINKVVTGLEKIQATAPTNKLKFINTLLAEAYFLQSEALQHGTIEENELGLKALDKALEIDPNNTNIKNARNSLAYELNEDIEKQPADFISRKLK